MHKFRGLKFLAGLGLAAGVGLMFCRMAEMRHEMLAEEARDPQAAGERRRFGHGHWHRGYPPMFDYWHRQAHAQENTAGVQPAPVCYREREGGGKHPAEERPQSAGDEPERADPVQPVVARR